MTGRQTDEMLKVEDVRRRLEGCSFFKEFLWHDSIASTNVLARTLADAGQAEGTVVWAEYQTGGKGRMGRKWLAAKSKNLIFSIITRPALGAGEIFLLTMALSLSVCQGVEAVAGIHPLIKWPNDIFVGQKKLGGILTEFALSDQMVLYAVTGLGLNVNWEPTADSETLYPVTSLRAELGFALGREGLLAEILAWFEKNYLAVLGSGRAEILEKWSARSMLLGRQVDVFGGPDKLTGLVLGIRKDGALLIRREDGAEQAVLSGDVSVRWADGQPST